MSDTAAAHPAADTPTPVTETPSDTMAEHGHSAAERRGRAELAQLRRLIREQFFTAVHEENLDLELANGMLVVFGMSPLPQRWLVRLTLTVRCEITATGQEDAYDTAAQEIDEALTAHRLPLDMSWDSVERLDARSDGLDTTHPDD